MLLLDLKPYCKPVATTHSSAFAVRTLSQERMAITLFSFATPHQTLCTRRSFTNCNSRFHSSTTLIRYPCKSIIVPLSSSSSSSSSLTSVMEDVPPPSSDALPATEDVDELPLSGCKGCRREEIENGCNCEGRIQGGIATVPGFGWWPIKAYRACPGFLASGGRIVWEQLMVPIFLQMFLLRFKESFEDEMKEQHKINLMLMRCMRK